MVSKLQQLCSQVPVSILIPSLQCTVHVPVMAMLCSVLLQVHKANLRGAGDGQGLEVAVKVQYPNALEVMLQVAPVVVNVSPYVRICVQAVKVLGPCKNLAQ